MSVQASANSETHDQQWFAIHTSVNQEKHVAESLDRRGIEFFLPLYRTLRKRSDRKVMISAPLFPGYLFVHIEETERRRVLEVPRVVGLISRQAKPVPLPNAEIDLLRRGLSGTVHAEPHVYLTDGCRVRIVNGPFEGIEGVQLGRSRNARVVVAVEVIMRAFTVEVSQQDLERI